MEKELEGDCSCFKFTGCEPCQQYTFHLKVFGAWLLIILVYHNEISAAVVSLAAVFVASRSAPPHWTRQKRLWRKLAQQASRAYESSTLAIVACLHFFSLTHLLNELLSSSLRLASERSHISRCRFSPPKKWNKSRHSRLLAQVSLQWTVTTESGYTKYFFLWYLLQAVSTKDTCDSDWSEPLVVTCPGAEKPLIKRIQSKQISCIRIGWERPALRGSARVESYKVLCVAHRGAIWRAVA